MAKNRSELVAEVAGKAGTSQAAVNSVLDALFEVFETSVAAGEKITDPDRQKELRAAVVLIKHFTHLLPRSPNPQAALLHFREFLEQLFQRRDWVQELSSLERSDVLQARIAVSQAAAGAVMVSAVPDTSTSNRSKVSTCWSNCSIRTPPMMRARDESARSVIP